MRLTVSRAMLAAICIGLASAASAHVTVQPKTSRAGAHEKYVVRVPTEGKVATTSVEVAIPEGVAVTSMGAAVGHTYELRRSGDRIVAIVWSMKISPGEFAEFAFIARNPKEGRELVWKAVQHFADGTSTQWSGPVGDKRPAPVTTLTAEDSGRAH